jgi:hypothetical protein
MNEYYATNVRASSVALTAKSVRFVVWGREHNDANDPIKTAVTISL